MRLFLPRALAPSFTSCLQAQAPTHLTHRSSTHTLRYKKFCQLAPRRAFTQHHTRQLPTQVPSMDNEQLSHTQSLDELSTLLKKIGISEVPKQPNTYPEVNPVDIYRSHITEILSPIAGVDAKIVYQALQWTNTLDKGDLVLAIPALRLKGRKPDEVANELASKVCPLQYLIVLEGQRKTDVKNSSPNPHSSSHPRSTKHTSNSSSSHNHCTTSSSPRS